MENLKTFANYARVLNVAVGTIYLWELKKKIKVVLVDGVKFVDVSDDEKYNNIVKEA